MNELIISQDSQNKENFPLMELPEGETFAIIPDVIMRELIPRTFLVTIIGDVFAIVESENSKLHQVLRDDVKYLNSLGFEDEEICEMFVSIHEHLDEHSVHLEPEEISKILFTICSKQNSPIDMFRKFKQLDTNDVVSIFKANNPLAMYEELTSLYDDEDDYDD